MNPYAIVGGLLLAIALFIGGWHFGAKNERADWQAKEIATQAANDNALKDAIDKAQRDQLYSEAKARKATQDHEQALDALQAKYDAAIAANRAAGGLRVSKSICDGAAASNQTASAGRPDEASARTVALPAETERRLFELTKEADALAEQLRALQGWIRDNGFYGQSP